MTDLKKSAKTYFEAYPGKQKLYATSDGNFFLNQSDAKNHSVKGKHKLYEFTRDGDGAEAGDPQDEVTVKLKARVLEIDPATGDHHEMKGILAGLNLKAESNKKADIIIALTNYKNQLVAESPANDTNPA